MTALTTLERVKRYIGQAVDYTDDDALLEDLLEGVSEAFRQYASQDFDLARYDEVYAGTGNSYLQLTQSPVKQILSVAVNSWPVDPGNHTGYILTGASLFRGQMWPKGPANVSVSYIAGYDAVPQDVQQAVVEVVALRYKLKEHIGMTSRAKGAASDTYDTSDLPEHVKSILDRYIDPALVEPVASLKSAYVPPVTP